MCIRDRSWTFLVLALVLFLFAIYIGFLCGQWACEKRVITKRDYWIEMCIRDRF